MSKYYIKWDEQDSYYIFDSENLTEDEFNEKHDYEGYNVFMNSLTGDEVVKLLNNLYNSYTRLKMAHSLLYDEVHELEWDKDELMSENMELKQFKDTIFILINEMIETSNFYRTPIKSIDYGDDLGYWNGVYQKLKELKRILEENGG